MNTVIDAHRHIGSAGYLGTCPAERVIRDMSVYGIDMTLLLPLSGMPSSSTEDSAEITSIDAANQDYFLRGIASDRIRTLQAGRSDHAEVIRAVAEHPGKLWGVFMVNPWGGDAALHEAEKAIRGLGFRALKLHPMANAFPADHEVVDPVMRLAQRLRVPVMFHSAFGLGTEPARIARVAARFASVAVVCYHCACGSSAGESIAAARENANVYLELSDAETNAVEEILAKAPPGQIVFGSDDPFYIGIAMFERMWWATKHDPDLRRLVLGETMARLVGIA